MSESTEGEFLLIARYLLAYLAWALLAVVGFWLIFRLRANLLDISTYLLEDPNSSRDSWIARAIDRWFIMLAGAAWVFCVALLEGYFRNSVPRKQLFQRLRRVVTIVAVITVLSYGLQTLFA